MGGGEGLPGFFAEAGAPGGEVGDAEGGAGGGELAASGDLRPGSGMETAQPSGRGASRERRR